MSSDNVNCIVEANIDAMIMAGSIDVASSVKGRRFTGTSVFTTSDTVTVIVNAMSRLRIWLGFIILRLNMNNLTVVEGDLETINGLRVFLNISTRLPAMTLSSGAKSSGSTYLLSLRVRVNISMSTTSVLHREASISAIVSLIVDG